MSRRIKTYKVTGNGSLKSILMYDLIANGIDPLGRFTMKNIMQNEMAIKFDDTTGTFKSCPYALSTDVTFKLPLEREKALEFFLASKVRFDKINRKARP